MGRHPPLVPPGGREVLGPNEKAHAWRRRRRIFFWPYFYLFLLNFALCTTPGCGVVPGQALKPIAGPPGNGGTKKSKYLTMYQLGALEISVRFCGVFLGCGGLYAYFVAFFCLLFSLRSTWLTTGGCLLGNQAPQIPKFDLSPKQAQGPGSCSVNFCKNDQA